MDFREIREFIKDMSGIIITVVIVILLKVYIISPIAVVGDSMKGTVNDADWLMMEMISPKFFESKRFQVVVCQGKNPKYIVKRIIGLPGETIEYRDNNLYINGEYMAEPFLPPGMITNDIGPINVPKGKYFVVGDNRVVSVDSRQQGSIDQEKILGKVIMRIWPLKEIKFVK